jgi:hypothetical protein
LSNLLTRQKLDLVEQTLSGDPAPAEVARQALSGPRRALIRDVVDIDELLQQFADGMMIKDLVAKHAISESSVKRLLRVAGARRRS